MSSASYFKLERECMFGIVSETGVADVISEKSVSSKQNQGVGKDQVRVRFRKHTQQETDLTRRRNSRSGGVSPVET